jgi:hypothetical protein
MALGVKLPWWLEKIVLRILHWEFRSCLESQKSRLIETRNFDSYFAYRCFHLMSGQTAFHLSNKDQPRIKLYCFFLQGTISVNVDDGTLILISNI